MTPTQTIAATSNTPAGFAPGSVDIASRRKVRYEAERMVLRGELFRAEPHRLLIRYFATQVLADAFMSSNPKPPKRAPGPKIRKPGAFIRAMIAAKCATPEGFQATDLPAEKVRAGYSHSQNMRDEGLIFGRKVGMALRYFDTAAKADAWEAAEKLLRPVVVHVERAAPKPRVDAVIVWPDSVKTQYIPTPAPRFTTYSSPLVRTDVRAMR